MEGCTVRVLGPVDVMAADGPVSVGGPQARAVLATLAIGVGHAVAVDLLHQTLWGDAPPASADNTLQSYISDLRHILGSSAISRVDHAYELDIDSQNIDAVRFETLLGRAVIAKEEPEECLLLCRDALALWRGRPFGDLADDEPFRLEAYRLDELRLATMELSIEADLALGNHELVVGELEVAFDDRLGEMDDNDSDGDADDDLSDEEEDEEEEEPEAEGATGDDAVDDLADAMGKSLVV